ncbi:MAG: UDP-N-acetylmuramate--L-alanine ligase [Eubacteriales bacterium]|nr:UDP-N-acetylmuramate--L-alanine ligase [Eubacteriales bacterium]
MTQPSRIQSLADLAPDARIYLVGIGGISMSGLAEIAQAAGYQVSGSDRFPGPRTQYLQAKGMMIHEGHDARWIDTFQPDLVVYTAAVHDDNPELIRARALGLTVIDRAEFLGWLNQTFRQVVNIAGTHGKTTTTALCSLILMAAAQNPTVHLGAELAQFGSTVHLGEPGELMVSEACEYMNSFLRFYSTVAAILNIDYDHVDFYHDIDDVIRSFVAFAARLPDDGTLVVPDFDDHVVTMLDHLDDQLRQSGRVMPRLLFFGNQATRKPDREGFYYHNLTFRDGLPEFDVWHDQTFYGHIRLRIPGLHNVHNTLAAIACAHLCGASPEAVVAVTESFRGAEGRFTETGHYRGARVIADYAHHPAAAKATLEAAAHIPHQHLWVVFQPLTFTRTRVLFDDYVNVLLGCEEVLFSEIYSDRDVAGPDHMSSRLLVERINELGGNARFMENFNEIRQRLDDIVQPGDLILVLGPENIRQFADQLTGRRLRETK